jgi:hypothetical protein
VKYFKKQNKTKQNKIEKEKEKKSVFSPCMPPAMNRGLSPAKFFKKSAVTLTSIHAWK